MKLKSITLPLHNVNDKTNFSKINFLRNGNKVEKYNTRRVQSQVLTANFFYVLIGSWKINPSGWYYYDEESRSIEWR